MKSISNCKKVVVICFALSSITVLAVFANYKLYPSMPINIEESLYFSPPEFQVPSTAVGCKNLVNQYCTKLYSNQARGNLKITDGKNDHWTLQGQTHNNLDNAKFAYHRARLDRRLNLPCDLLAAVEKREFFSKLKNILARPNKRKLKFEEGILHKELENSVDSIWNHAIEETIGQRLEKKFPGAYMLTEEELPQEAELERSRIRYSLWSEISIALWRGNSRWKTVQRDFDGLKSAFKIAIKNQTINPEVEKRWLDKIDRVKLNLPGQNPITANQDCISTSRNAYYYPYLNTLTVCAGYFNGGEQIQTLAHELAHSLDFNSRLVDYHQSSSLTKSMRALRKKVCSREEFSCRDWADFKLRFASEVSLLGQYQTEVRPFHQCLQKSSPSKKINDQILKEKADKITKYRFSDLTKNSSFFRLTSPTLPLPTGEIIKNPNFLNPCAYDLWSSNSFPIDAELTSLLFFTASYQCEAKTSQNPMRFAVDVSKRMTTELIYIALKNEGEFSARDDLQAESYSSPPTERFADKLGSFAVGEYLRRFKNSTEKRANYLVSSFWLCDRPSLRTSNYQQFQALRDLIVDRTVHLENDERTMDWLSPPVREQLDCQLDFKHKECLLSGTNTLISADIR